MEKRNNPVVIEEALKAKEIIKALNSLVKFVEDSEKLQCVYTARDLQKEIIRENGAWIGIVTNAKRLLALAEENVEATKWDIRWKQ